MMAAIVSNAAIAQTTDESFGAGTLYLTAGVGATFPPSGSLEDGGSVTINGVLPLSALRLPSDLAPAVGIRFEALETSYGEALYSGTDPRFVDEQIYSATRSHSVGLQTTRPGPGIFRPYAALSIARVTFVLDAGDEKLERRAGAGAVLRAGSYVAFSRGSTPFVLDLSAAYHANGTRDQWRPGETVAVRDRADMFELSARIGFASHPSPHPGIAKVNR